VAQTLARAGWKVSARSVRRIGRERHGQGPAVGRLGIVQRFASTENIFATARLERFWRTLKDTSGIRLQPPLTIEDLERRLEMTLSHYVLFRPHQGLHGATPAEAVLGMDCRACLLAVSPPRGRPGEGPVDAPFVIDFLDREKQAFPFLTAA